MGYQFYNNWPYYDSVFPTMEDHLDPVNHDYFTGLHLEIQNIENELGLNPSGIYNTVRDRLDLWGEAHTQNMNNPHEVTLEQARSQNKVVQGHIGFNYYQAEYMVIHKGTGFPANPVEGLAFYRTDQKQQYIYNGTAWVPMQGFPVRNILDNGDFEIFQRGDSDRADRWQTPQALGKAKETTIIHHGKSSFKFQALASGEAINIEQPIFGYEKYAGKTLTFSIWIYKASGNNQYQALIVDNAGTSASSWESATGSWVNLVVTRTITDPCTSLKVSINTKDDSAKDLYLDEAMLVEGPITGYVFDPPVIELQRCQRYYWKTDHFAMGNHVTAASIAMQQCLFPVKMSWVPAMVVSGGTYINASGAMVHADRRNEDGFTLEISISGAGWGYWVINPENPGSITAASNETPS